MISRACVERGLGRTTKIIVRTVSLTASGNRGDTEEFCYPLKGPVEGLQLRANYETVRAGDGFPEPGTVLRHNDVLVGKVTRSSSTPARPPVCRSVVYDGLETAIVDSVALTSELSGTPMVVVKLRVTLNLLAGDKLSSRYGQKGTVGRIVDQCDMPFSPRNGMSPDIVINPLAIPSRMTVC